MTSRLFVYGTLAPGRANAHVLAAMGGTWEDGTIRGVLHDAGWGAALGCPGLTLDPQGDVVPGQLFHSAELADEWAALDAFEGDGYERVTTDVETDSGTVVRAWVYVLRAR